MGGVGTVGVVACVQEVAVTPGELLADADLIHYTMGASEKDEEEASSGGQRTEVRGQSAEGRLTARRQTVDWSGLPCEVRFWDWKLGPAKAHYL